MKLIHDNVHKRKITRCPNYCEVLKWIRPKGVFCTMPSYEIVHAKICKSDFLDKECICNGDITKCSHYKQKERTNMNYSKQIFEMLSIEPNEWFKLNAHPDHEFRMNDKLHVFYRRKSDKIEYEHFSVLHSILSGNSTIIKIPKPTQQEQLAIDYAKACYYKWLAKDNFGSIFAFKDKPEKDTKLREWTVFYGNKDCLYIQIPISFIHWEDDEPYYIGD